MLDVSCECGSIWHQMFVFFAHSLTSTAWVVLENRIFSVPDIPIYWPNTGIYCYLSVFPFISVFIPHMVIFWRDRTSLFSLLYYGFVKGGPKLIIIPVINQQVSIRIGMPFNFMCDSQHQQLVESCKMTLVPIFSQTTL